MEITNYDMNLRVKRYNSLGSSIDTRTIARDDLRLELIELRKERKSIVKIIQSSLKVVNLSKVKEKDKVYKTYVEFIIDVVSTAFGTNPIDINSSSRKRELVYARNLLIFAIKKHKPNMSLDKIGLIVNRDRTNCIHSVKSHSLDVVGDNQYSNGYEIAMPLIDNYFENN